MWTVQFLSHEHPRAALGSIGPAIETPQPSKGRHFSSTRCDQAFGAKFLEQIEDLAFANVRIDSVVGKQRRTEITNSNRLCEQIPDARTHPVHPVAGALLNAESHNLAVNFGFD